jgi:hypothetical protein
MMKKNDSEGSGRGLIEVFSRPMPRETEENHEIP